MDKGEDSQTLYKLPKTIQFINGRASVSNRGSLIPETSSLNIMKYCQYVECNFPIFLSTKLGHIMPIIKIPVMSVTAVAY